MKGLVEQSMINLAWLALTIIAIILIIVIAVLFFLKIPLSVIFK